MISPENLRRYSFFGFLKGSDLDKVAMFSESVTWKKGDAIFNINDEAVFIYLLENGDINLHYEVLDNLVSGKGKEFFVGDINPGEPFGLSGLIEPFKVTATAIAGADSAGIKIDAIKLRELAQQNPILGVAMMKEVAQTAFERLGRVRVELVASRA